MQDFIKHFRRDAFGAWLCLEPATLDLPTGRIQVTPGSKFTKGTTFMNVDLAMLLEEHHRETIRTSTGDDPAAPRHPPFDRG